MSESLQKKIKIAYILPQLSGGGAERMVIDLATHLPASLYLVFVITLKDAATPVWEEELTQANVQVVKLHKKFKLDIFCIWRLIKWLTINRPDILHTHLFGGDFYGRLAGHLARVPHIIGTEHNINRAEGRLRRWLKRLTAPWAEKIIAVSGTVLDYVERYEGVTSSQAMVIYNGVPLEKFRPSYLITNDSWPCDIKKIVVGGLGRLEYQKNWPCLIRAATKLPNNVIIKIAGIGREMKKLQRLICSLGLEKRVELVDWQDSVKFLSQLDIFVLPSWWEGLPISLLEAGAVGLPVIVADIPSNREIVRDTTLGLWFDPHSPEELAEKLKLLINEPAMARRMAANLHQVIERQFSSDLMRQRYQEVYESLLNN
ncbi:MAG TPA: glycosyltransferase [bacterium]|nr:glycosyltransferase [bacterium]HPU92169.1 glycosyltransferase [bacterium]